MNKQLHQIKDKDGKVLMEQVVDLPDDLANEMLGYKPTTLREEFKKKFEGYWRGEVIPDEICFWWLSKFISHSTELLRKIEGEIVEIRKIWESYDEYEKIINIAKIETLEKVINLINQENIQISGDGKYFKKGNDIYKNNEGEWEIINQEPKNKSGTDGSISGYGGRGGDGSKV